VSESSFASFGEKLLDSAHQEQSSTANKSYLGGGATFYTIATWNPAKDLFGVCRHV
jgi:hypothetical protein